MLFRSLDRVSFLSEQGADIILCSHPHILKGYELLTREDKGKTLVYYSLGNFASGQTALENLLGGMADITIKKNADSGKISIEDYSLVPLVMHYNSDFSEAGIYKLSDYSEELASEHASRKQNTSGEEEDGDDQESDDGEEDTDTGFSLRALEKAADAIGELKDGKTQEDDTEDKDSADEDSENN